MRGKEHSSPRRAHSRCGQHPGRQGFPGDGKSVGLETESQNLQRDQQAPETIPSGLVFLKGINPTGRFYSWIPDPLAMGINGHLPPSMDGTNFCNHDTLGLDTLCLDTGSNSEGQHCTGRPSVKDTGMVPTPIATPVRLPNPNSSRGDNDTPSQPTSTTISGTGGIFGRMAYIRRSYETRKLSKEATRL